MLDNIDVELDVAAKEIQKLLAGRMAKTVSLGAIRFASDDAISHGPGLGLRLKSRLVKAGMTIDPEARFGILGEYAWKDDPRTKRVIIQLDLSVVDRQKSNTKLVTISRGIKGENALIELLSPAVVALPPGMAEERREDALIESIEKKLGAVFDGAVVYPDATKTYGLQIQVKGPDGKYVGRRPRVDDGDLLIDLKKGETFRILLHNNSRMEAAAAVMIDGLNTFSFGAVREDDRKAEVVDPVRAGVRHRRLALRERQVARIPGHELRRERGGRTRRRQGQARRADREVCRLLAQKRPAPGG